MSRLQCELRSTEGRLATAHRLVHELEGELEESHGKIATLQRTMAGELSEASCQLAPP